MREVDSLGRYRHLLKVEAPRDPENPGPPTQIGIAYVCFLFDRPSEGKNERVRVLYILPTYMFDVFCMSLLCDIPHFSYLHVSWPPWT